MYNTHATIIDQNSNLNLQSAKLACIINDISAKQESIITRSVSETGRKGSGFGTVEETLSGLGGRCSAQPEAYGLRGASSNNCLVMLGHFPISISQLENDPSSEPDEFSKPMYRPKCRYDFLSRRRRCGEATLFVELFLKVLWRTPDISLPEFQIVSLFK